MDKIKRLSSYVIGVTKFILGTLPIAYLLGYLYMDSPIMQTIIDQTITFHAMPLPDGVTKLSQIKWSGTSRLVAFIGFLLTGLSAYLSLVVLHRIFKNYRDAQVFTVQNATYYKYLGILCFVDALILKPVGQLLFILGATLTNPPGQRYLSLSFGTPNVETLYIGVVVLIISWVMREATALKSDQDYTI